MKTPILFALFSILLGCASNTDSKVEANNQPSPQSTINEVNDTPDTLELFVLDSTRSNDSIKVYLFQDLTAWGGINLVYANKKLVTIKSQHSGEYGSKKIVYQLREGVIQKVKYIVHDADRKAYRKKYGEVDLDESKMTYNDRTVIYDSIAIQTKNSEELNRLLNDGKEIIKYLETLNQPY